jgi:hypothetical protein
MTQDFIRGDMIHTGFEKFAFDITPEIKEIDSLIINSKFWKDLNKISFNSLDSMTILQSNSF